MGSRLGIYKDGKRPASLYERGKAGQLVEQANIFPSEQMIPTKEWERIVAFYNSAAPSAIAVPGRNVPIRMGLPNFDYRSYKLPRPAPLTSFVSVIPETSKIVFGTMIGRSYTLNILNKNLKDVKSYEMSALPIQCLKISEGSYSLTTIGRGLFPTDAPDGWVKHLTAANFEAASNDKGLVLTELQRPVHLVYKDLNADGLEDIITCEFGSLTGKLAWYENKGQQYQVHTLIAQPGATRVVVDDVDADGRPDILALMAQGNEGIFYFHNTEDGFAPAKQLLSFSPLFGSTYFDYIDFNRDGLKDIIYTSGDNADKTPLLKEYHGIYVFLGQRDLSFKQHFFYQLNGAFKAIAKDYDFDGDLDIAAISYFPDYEHAPEEGFVYLQNEGNFKFNASTFPEVGIGRWISMDADDYDKDGDIDIVLGSNISILPTGDKSGINNRWLKEGISLVILENNIKN